MRSNPSQVYFADTQESDTTSKSHQPWKGEEVRKQETTLQMCSSKKVTGTLQHCVYHHS